MNLINWWSRQTDLHQILLAGGLARLLAAIFSAGYAMHDDHFLVAEVAQQWVDGLDPNGWITSTYETNTSGRSLVYPGLHYFFFRFLESIGLFDPKLKMLLVRLLHALWSLWAVYLAYMLTLSRSNAQTARRLGWIMALLWLMPYISVRNLAETACIPLLLAGASAALRSTEEKRGLGYALMAGIWFGLSFSFRYQAILFGLGVVAAFFLVPNAAGRPYPGLRYADKAVVAFLGMLLPIGILHGLVEWWVWGYPFGKIEYYVKYNILNAGAYITQSWYNYILLLAGLAFPLSVVYWWGVLQSWRKHLLLFSGFMIFFVFHSYFPNKQERFIFTVIPVFFILGITGWEAWKAQSPFWLRREKLIRLGRRIFWVLNSLGLLLFTTYYPKQGKVDAMYYLYKKTGNQALVVENVFSDNSSVMPAFYTGIHPDIFYYKKPTRPDDLRNWMNNGRRPEYVLFIGGKNLDARVDTLRQVMPGLQPVYRAEANFMDNFLHWLNPVNKTEEVFIYK